MTLLAVHGRLNLAAVVPTCSYEDVVQLELAGQKHFHSLEYLNQSAVQHLPCLHLEGQQLEAIMS